MSDSVFLGCHTVKIKNRHIALSGIMLLKYKLQFLYFMECAIWGAYLTTLGAYLSHHLHFSGMEIGFVYSFISLSCLLTLLPAGILADRFVSASHLYAILQFSGGIFLLCLGFASNKISVAVLIFLISMVYLPTLPLSNALMLYNCHKADYDKNKEIPIIRVYGSIGFIASVWIVSFLGWSVSPKQFFFGAICAFITALIPFIIHKVPVGSGYKEERQDFPAFIRQMLHFLRNKDIAVFFALAIPVGILVQFSDLFSSTYLLEKDFPYFAIVNSLSQISSIGCGLILIYFLKHCDFKTVIMIALGSWAIRNFCFALGSNISIFAGLAVYGFAFEFFIVGSSLFIYQMAGERLRAFSQALFLMLFNGIGGIAGSFLSGSVYDYFTLNNIREWSHIWYIYAALAVLIFVLFVFAFHYKGKLAQKE